MGNHGKNHGFVAGYLTGAKEGREGIDRLRTTLRDIAQSPETRRIATDAMAAAGAIVSRGGAHGAARTAGSANCAGAAAITRTSKRPCGTGNGSLQGFIKDLCPCSHRPRVDLTGSMFVAHELVLDISSQAAQARLANLAYGDGLTNASQDAYQDGLASLIRVGPLGDLPGASKLVRVRFLDPLFRDDTMTLGLRWEATGVTSGLFPVFDADITLTTAGEHTTRLALAGAYRPPLGRLGAALDKAILNQLAAATVRALLRNVANALAKPGTAADRHPGPASGPAPRLIIEPEKSS